MEDQCANLACEIHDELELLALRNKEVRLCWLENGRLHSLRDRMVDFVSKDGIEHIVTANGTRIRSGLLLSADERLIQNPFKTGGEELALALSKAEATPLFSGSSAPIDLSKSNPALQSLDFTDIDAFSTYVNQQHEQAGTDYLIGGYGESRNVYAHDAESYGAGEDYRDVHIGEDWWAPAGTPVSCPLPGTVHSVSNNQGKADYGPTLILRHQIGEISFYTLYGHLAWDSISQHQIGKEIADGQKIAELGDPKENGNWPPHVHFQVVMDMLGNEGDFPGVCHRYDLALYLSLCPNPAVLWGNEESQ